MWLVVMGGRQEGTIQPRERYGNGDRVQGAKPKGRRLGWTRGEYETSWKELSSVQL